MLVCRSPAVQGPADAMMRQYRVLCPLTPLLNKDHTQGVTEVFIQCVLEDSAREGRTSSAENHGSGKTEGCGTRGKRLELIYTPQGFQTRTGP